MMARRGILTLVLVTAAARLSAQTPPTVAQFDYGNGASAWPNFTRVYESPVVPPVVLGDSSRLERLIQGGKLYLSLGDAIALALENNLDVAYARYEPLKADTDILRAKSGSQLRGIQTQISTLSTGQSSGAGGGGGGGGAGNISGVESRDNLGGGASGVGSASSFLDRKSVV